MVDVFRLIQFSSATVRVGMSRALFQRARNREKKKKISRRHLIHYVPKLLGYTSHRESVQKTPREQNSGTDHRQSDRKLRKTSF